MADLDVSKLAAFRAKKALQEAEQAPVPVEDKYSNFGLEDVNEKGTFQRTQEDQTIDGIVNSLTVEQAFNKFLTKKWATKGGGGHEIMMRCPTATHTDKDPSASYNPATQLWTCHGCHKGGDPIDIAAIGLGYDYEGGTYKQGKTFVELRKEIASKLGYTALPKAPGQKEQKYAPPVEEPPAQVTPPMLPPAGLQLPAPSVALSGSPATVTPITAAPSHTEAEITGEVDVDANFSYPAMPDYKTIFAPDSFLYKYLEATAHLPYPDEYNFWHALIGIGGVLGRDVWYPGQPRVYGNLYICTVGPTGGGKSRSSYAINTIMREVLHYVEDDVNNKGVKIIPTPNSEVFLIDEMRRVIENPASTPKVTLPPELYPIKALVEYAEMSSFMAKTKGQNGGKYEGVIIEFYDCKNEVSTGSMGSGIKRAPEPFMQLTTTTQLKSIKRLLSEDNAASGLLNRFVFSMGPTLKRTFHDDDIDLDLRQPTDALTRMKAFYALNPGKIGFTPDGHAASADLYNRKARKLQEDDASDLLARLDLLLKKLLLLFAANDHKKMIDKAVVDQVEAFFAYIIACYQVIGARIGITLQGELEQKVVNAIQSYAAHNPTLPYPTATNISKNLSQKVPMKDLRSILDTLAALAVIEAIEPVRQPGQRGVLGMRYRYAV